MPTEICNEMGNLRKYEFLSDFNYLNSYNILY
jgi:hypothetical protein